jgi:hypothetical protein
MYTEEDFVCECDLFITCLAPQKQIENIVGKKENIGIPALKLKQIREQNGELLIRIFLISIFLFSRITYV